MSTNRSSGKRKADTTEWHIYVPSQHYQVTRQRKVLRWKHLLEYVNRTYHIDKTYYTYINFTFILDVPNEKESILTKHKDMDSLCHMDSTYRSFQGSNDTKLDGLSRSQQKDFPHK